MRSEALELSTDPLDEAGAWNTSLSRLICLPSDVIARKAEIEARMSALRFDARDCTVASREMKANVEAFYLAWRVFYCRSDDHTCASPQYTIWGLCDQLNDCDTWEAQLFAWQKQVSAAGCASTAPQGPTVPPGGQQAVSDAVRWAVLGIAILAGVYVASKTGLPRLFGGKKARP